MKTFFQERQNHTKTSIAVKVSRSTQNVEICLGKEASDPALFCTDSGYVFGSNLGNDFGVLLQRKGPHTPLFAFDVVRIPSLMRYTDLIEQNLVGEKKSHCCAAFFSFSA